MQACLSRHVASPTALRLAPVVAQAAGLPGWCALDRRHRLHAGRGAECTLDGAELHLQWRGGAAAIPSGRILSVTRSGVPLLGSPIDLAAIGVTEGFVEATAAGGLSGWAWHPGDPARDPVLAIAGETILQLTARDVREHNRTMPPLARPRHFTVSAADLPAGALHVTGPDGRDLLGSPLDPGLERRSAAALAAGQAPLWAPVWADVVGTAPNGSPRTGPVDVVVPVYGGFEQTMACLDSVLATLPHGSRLHVVDDCSPDPRLTAALQDMAQRGLIRLLRQPRNRGYPAAVNAGMAAAAGRDVVLLNSDTLVPPGWLQVLTAAARHALDIGTACPLSNDATILSYPAPAGSNPMPGLAETAARAALAHQANGAAAIDIPVAVGFCMFIRRDCLDQVGLFREDVFAQGYGEENDFCLRARHLGWRHVAATGTFVAHQGGASFKAGQIHLRDRNARVLARLHPGYDTMIAEWIERDPLAPARRRMDTIRWRAGRRPSAVVLVTHGGTGGVTQVIAERAAALRAAGIRPVILRPDGAAAVVGDDSGEPTPNLRFRMPGELPALIRLLRAERPAHVELHHLLGHDPAMLALAARLAVPHEVYIHDYAWFCARIALVQDHSYCGEPPISGCEACVADHGRNIEEDITVEALVARSQTVLGGARRVVVPGQDVALRLRRHFPMVPTHIQRWEDDLAIAPPAPPQAVRTICVIGAIGREKGYEVLLACLRDAASRALPLRFVLVGYSSDDQRLLDAGPIVITGPYQSDEVDSLIRAQAADIAFLPSIWPETWCFTLGHAWRAGLRVALFDLGTPAERLKRTGWGWVLPLGLPPPAVNDWMLRLNSVQQQSFSATRGAQSRCQPSPKQRNGAIR
jgi:GT2 family glycosyltransferase/glycosyltransferase involved in cell wall biosynthesis